MRCPSSFGDPAWVLVVVHFSWMFSLALAFTFAFAHGLAPFSDVFDHSQMSLLQRVLRWIALHVLLFKPTLGFFVPDSPTTIAESTKLSLFTTLGLKSESFTHFSFAPCATTLSKVGTPLSFPPFTGPLPTGAMNPAWFLSSRETYSDGTDSTSNVVECLVVQFYSCKLPPSDTITYAFTSSCRVFLSNFVPLSNIDSWVW